MTFRELPVGAMFRFATDAADALDLVKIAAGTYSVNGWCYFVIPEKRAVEVIRIDTPKEGEK